MLAGFIGEPDAQRLDLGQSGPGRGEQDGRADVS